MVVPLCLGFDDFKELSDGKRIYFFVGNDYYDFVFLVDSVYVKTTMLNRNISNPTQFFSDKMFYGAKRIYFRIPNPYFNPLEDVASIKTGLEKPLVNIVEAVQDEEVKNTDIQVEGIKDA